ncbi:MAG: hypothetical protein ACI4M6_05875 [Christensenellaceae bacterium]
MDVGTIIAIASVVISAIAVTCTIIGVTRDRKKDDYNAGKDDGGIRGDIKYMRNSFDDLRLDVKEVARKQDTQGERLTRVEESCKQAHKRIDEVARHVEYTGGHNE